MSADAVIIANAIASIKSESTIFKDYIFPVIMSFLSSFLALLAAYWIYKRQERVKKEKENYDKSKTLIISIFESSNDLVALKLNYHRMSTSSPLERVFLVPPFISRMSRLQVAIGDFLFIKEVQTANKKFCERLFEFINYKCLRKKKILPSPQEIGKTWRNLSRLSACVNNFNFILATIEERTVLIKECKAVLSEYGKVHKVEINPQMAFDIIGNDDMVPLIDLTEVVISTIDYVIREMNSFLSDFPDVAESNIELRLVGKNSRLPKVINDRPLYLDCLKPIVPPDYIVLSSLMRLPLDEVKYKYTYNEWY